MLNNSTQQASEAFEKALLLDPEETATLQNYGRSRAREGY